MRRSRAGVAATRRARGPRPWPTSHGQRSISNCGSRFGQAVGRSLELSRGSLPEPLDRAFRRVKNGNSPQARTPPRRPPNGPTRVPTRGCRHRRVTAPRGVRIDRHRHASPQKRDLVTDPPPTQRSRWIRQEPSEPDADHDLISCQITSGTPSRDGATWAQISQGADPIDGAEWTRDQRPEPGERRAPDTDGRPGPSHTWSGPFPVRTPHRPASEPIESIPPTIRTPTR